MGYRFRSKHLRSPKKPYAEEVAPKYGSRSVAVWKHAHTGMYSWLEGRANAPFKKMDTSSEKITMGRLR